MPTDLRRRMHEILEVPSRAGDRAGRAFDRFIVALIILNVAAVVVETVEPISAGYGKWFHAFELFSLAVFSVEFVARLWSVTADPRYPHPVKGRLRFLATPMALVDLVAILPAFAIGVDLRMMRILRLLRLFKLSRYSATLQLLNNVLWNRRRELGMSLLIVGIALVLTSSLVYYAEHEAQPEAFPDIPSAMWWGIVTLATVGYGDIVPVTAMGKLLAGVTILVGLLVLALPVGIVASGFVEELRRTREETRCPHCDKRLSDDPHMVPVTPHEAL